MTEPKIPRLDPERLQSEQHDVDLGDAETVFAKQPEDAEALRSPSPTDEPTSGMTPPAR